MARRLGLVTGLGEVAVEGAIVSVWATVKCLTGAFETWPGYMKAEERHMVGPVSVGRPGEFPVMLTVSVLRLLGYGGPKDWVRWLPAWRRRVAGGSRSSQGALAAEQPERRPETRGRLGCKLVGDGVEVAVSVVVVPRRPFALARGARARRRGIPAAESQQDECQREASLEPLLVFLAGAEGASPA